MDRLQEMASFVAVVDAGSFVGATSVTGLSKAALSRHVAALEERLGVRLLHRSTRRLSLTDDGQRFHARAKDLLVSVEEMETELSSHATEASGLLRVNAPQSFGVLHLAPLWGRFAEQHPRLSLDIVLNDRTVDVVEEAYDLTVRITNLPSSQLISRKLASTRMIACASPQYLREHGPISHPHDLAHHRTVAYSYWSHHDLWEFHGPTGAVSVRTQPFMHSNSGDTCRLAALAHQGVILQPDFIIGPDLQRGDLVEVMPEYRAIEIGIHAVYASRRQLPIKTRKLLDFLVNAFATPAWQQGQQAIPHPTP